MARRENGDHTPDHRPADATAPADAAHLPNRTLEMQLLHEDMARAHMAHYQAESAADMRTLRLAAAVRAQRRAQQATLRARRLLMLAVAR